MKYFALFCWLALGAMAVTYTGCAQKRHVMDYVLPN